MPKPATIAARDVDPVRIARMRADAKRPMNVNLAEGIALSNALAKFAGAARER